jgi:hypothetical protein
MKLSPQRVATHGNSFGVVPLLRSRLLGAQSRSRGVAGLS